MYPHYKITSLEVLVPEDVTGNLPKFCKHPLDFAKADLYTLVDAEFLEQYFDAHTAYLQFFNVNAFRNFETSFKVLEKNLVLSFHFNKEMTFCRDDGTPIIKIEELTFFAAFNKPGNYKVKYKKGVTSQLVISIDLDWAAKIFADQPTLLQLLEDLHNEEGESNNFLLPCPIDRKISTILQRFPSKKNKCIGEIDTKVLTCIVDLVKIYEKLAKVKTNDLIDKAINHLYKNFRDPTLNPDVLIDISCLGKSAFNKNFKLATDTTAGELIFKLRADEARVLVLKYKTRRLEKIAEESGFGDVGKLRYHYLKYFETSPEEDRSKEK